MTVNDLAAIVANSATVAFHKFVLLSHGREMDIFCFFEGRDSQYYSSRVRQMTKRNFHAIVCGNKKSVIETFRKLESNPAFSSFRKAYFVDRDFDDPINDPALYETPTYSIENFYTNESCLREILKSEFGLLETDDAFKSAIELFKKEQNDFHQASILYNAWYAALKKKAKVENRKPNVSLSDNFPKNFICLKIGSISSAYDLQKIKSIFPDALDISEEEVLLVKEKLQACECCEVLRGKFEILFFYEFLQFLIADANQNRKLFDKKTKFNVDKGLILSQISQYAITPPCLGEYLKGFQ